MTEHEIQKMVVKYCRQMEQFHSDYSFIFAIPNGGKRNIQTAVKLKSEGVLAGVSDLMVPIPSGEYNGAFIEVKTEKGRASQAQKSFLLEMKNRGYFTAITHGYDETVAVIDSYIAGVEQEKIEYR